MAGKGSKRRKENTKKINDNWDNIDWASTHSKQEEKFVEGSPRIHSYTNTSGEEVEIMLYQEESRNKLKTTAR